MQISGTIFLQHNIKEHSKSIQNYVYELLVLLGNKYLVYSIVITHTIVANL